MKVVPFKAEGEAPDRTEMLGVIDRLRADVESGRVVRFAGVGITLEEAVLAYCASADPAPDSQLQMLGAIASLQYHYIRGGFNA